MAFNTELYIKSVIPEGEVLGANEYLDSNFRDLSNHRTFNRVFSNDNGVVLQAKDGDFTAIGQDITMTEGQEYEVRATVVCPPPITNIVPYSEDFSQWSSNNAFVLANISGAPNNLDGSSDLIRTTAGGAAYIQSVISKDSEFTRYTASMYVKQDDLATDYVAIRFQGAFPNRIDYTYRFSDRQFTADTHQTLFQNVSTSVKLCDDNWFKLQFQFVSDNASNLNMIVSPRETEGVVDAPDTASTSQVEIFGAMINEGQVGHEYYVATDGAATTVTTEGGQIRLQDSMDNDGALTSDDTVTTLKEGVNELVFRFTANSDTDGIYIMRHLLNNSIIHVLQMQLNEVIFQEASEDLQRLDMKDNVKLNLNDSVKDSKDFGKLFSLYTTQFSLPATARNNRAFDRYFDNSVVNANGDLPFDARIKVPAQIAMDGAVFKVGRLELTNVIMKNGRPNSYKCVFYGGNANLKDRIKEDTLKDLVGTSLDNYNVASLSTEDLMELFQADNSTDASPAVVMPFISYDAKYYVSNVQLETDEFNTQNLYKEDNGTRVADINLGDFRPSVKVTKILEAVAEKYNFTWGDDFINTSNTDISELYMACNQSTGRLGIDNEESLTNRHRINLRSLSFIDNNSASNSDPSMIQNEIVTQSNTNQFFNTIESDIRRYQGQGATSGELDTLNLFSVKLNTSLNAFNITTRNFKPKELAIYINADVSDVSLGEASIAYLKDAQGNTLAQSNFDNSFSFITTQSQVSASIVFQIPEGFTYHNEGLYIEIAGVSVIEYNNVNVYLGGAWGDRFNNRRIPNYSKYSTPDFTLGNGEDGNDFSIAKNLPDMKVSDFITSIFKMFNLVPQLVDDNIIDGSARIEVKTWEQFYAQGSELDLTRFFNTKEYNISKASVYGNIKFNFTYKDTILMREYKEIFGRVYGDLSIDDTMFTDNFASSSKYEVKPKFSKLIYQRQSFQDGDQAQTHIQNGWSVDKDGKPVDMGALLHYVRKRNLQTGKIGAATAGSTDSIGIAKFTFNSLTVQASSGHYYAPSNFNYLTGNSINFNSEQNPWYAQGGSPDDLYSDLPYLMQSNLSNGSLYNNYYDTYISNLYDPQARRYEVNVMATRGMLLNLSMDKTIRIGDKRFIIDKYQASLATGKMKLTLVTISDEELTNLIMGFTMVVSGDFSLVTISEDDVAGLDYISNVAAYDRSGTNPIIINVETADATYLQTLRDNNTPRVEVSGTVGSTAGTYVITYTAIDAFNNVQVFTKTFIVESSGSSATATAPTITITGGTPVNHTAGNAYTDLGATASDTIDGDLTSSITSTDNVDPDTVGTYTVTYSVTNSNGMLTIATRTVNVTAAATAPTLTLINSSTINLTTAQTYIEYGATASDATDGNLTPNITISGTVNTSVAGTYFKTYSVTNSSGLSTSKTRTIVVTQSSSGLGGGTGSSGSTGGGDSNPFG